MRTRILKILTWSIITAKSDVTKREAGLPRLHRGLPVAALVVLVAVLAPDGAELDLCEKAGR